MPNSKPRTKLPTFLRKDEGEQDCQPDEQNSRPFLSAAERRRARLKSRPRERIDVVKFVFAICFAVFGVSCFFLAEGQEDAFLFYVSGVFAIVIAPIWYRYGAIDLSKCDPPPDF